MSRMGVRPSKYECRADWLTMQPGVGFAQVGTWRRRGPRGPRHAFSRTALVVTLRQMGSVRSAWRRLGSVRTPLTGVLTTAALVVVLCPSAAAAIPKVKTPSAPTDVSAIAEDGAVAVSWSPPASDGGAAITSYVVLADKAQGCATSLDSCTAAGLANGERYTVRVRALNAAGEGRASTSVHVTPTPYNFGNPQPVTIEGYSGDAMEPFVSPDGNYLFFNNSNTAAQTNLYYAQRINDTTFVYEGEIAGVDSASLDAVPSMDSSGDFYFVSTRSYSETLSTIYEGQFSDGSVAGVALVPGVSKDIPGWVNFDADISTDGNTLYFDDGEYSPSGQLLGASLSIAAKTQDGFERLRNAGELLKNVNDPSALVYAADISSDGLQLYFTRAPLPLGSASPSIYVATRTTTSSDFGKPTQLTQLTGFVEAPALSPDGQGLYFHELVGDAYVIEFARRL
jgi:hypothetical protein